MPGECRARDAEGHACARGVVHPLHMHQSTGLREWLEQGSGRAIIRPYELGRADQQEAIEAPLFARFEFVPITRQDLGLTADGGLNELWSIWVSPMIAPREHVHHPPPARLLREAMVRDGRRGPPGDPSPDQHPDPGSPAGHPAP